MKLRLRQPEAPVPALDSRARDCAWDQTEKMWRVFSDDCGAFLCFATAEQVKARFPSKYLSVVGEWAWTPAATAAAAMTPPDREIFNRTTKRPSSSYNG